jgi:hypothetical protein
VLAAVGVQGGGEHKGVRVIAAEAGLTVVAY